MGLTDILEATFSPVESSRFLLFLGFQKTVSHIFSLCLSPSSETGEFLSHQVSDSLSQFFPELLLVLKQRQQRARLHLWHLAISTALRPNLPSQCLSCMQPQELLSLSLPPQWIKNVPSSSSDNMFFLRAFTPLLWQWFCLFICFYYFWFVIFF